MNTVVVWYLRAALNSMRLLSPYSFLHTSVGRFIFNTGQFTRDGFCYIPFHRKIRAKKT